MAAIVAELLKQARKAFFESDEDALKLLSEHEKTVDTIHEKVGRYLNKISTVMLNEEDRNKYLLKLEEEQRISVHSYFR